MPCRIAGCTQTWTWYGSQQIRSLGKPPPKRMCSDHLAQFDGIGDRQMPCRNSWCTNTWQWSRGAQLYQREQKGKLKAPHRLCESCFGEERETGDTRLACKIPECENTWEWTRDAQLRHRSWVRRQQAKYEAQDQEDAEADATPASRATAEAPTSDAGASSAGPEDAVAVVAATDKMADDSGASSTAPTTAADVGEASVASEPMGEASPESVSSDAPSEAKAGEGKGKGKKRRRKRRRKRKIHDGPPEKLCERCFERLGHLATIAIPCKVHGCTSTWNWEREGQLRAWAQLDKQEEVTALPQPPRRMCTGCFEFVRHHSDRAVDCGRPDCDKTWMYKTGAQLQDFLAGRTLEPIRLCESCSHSQFTLASASGVALPEGAEVMPCQVPACEGSWVYVPGMALAPSDPDASEVPVDRMCDDCRAKTDAPARDPRRSRAVAELVTTPVSVGSEVAGSEAAGSEADGSDPAGSEADGPEAGGSVSETEPDTGVEAPEPDVGTSDGESDSTGESDSKA